jgi:hypothetical protein
VWAMLRRAARAAATSARRGAASHPPTEGAYPSPASAAGWNITHNASVRRPLPAPFSSSASDAGGKKSAAVSASAAAVKSSSSSQSAEQLIRAGKPLEFEQAAEMVFSEPMTRLGHRRTLGWDWHAWHFFCALMPACLAYALVLYSEVGERGKGRGGGA